LAENYDPNWKLTHLVRRRTGIHNGGLHRSLSQIQIRLFEEKSGLDNMVSTSSIIEGVNTSAENVVLWRNRNGQSKLTDFSYKNIIGRGGRMFRHFIGKVYILDAPPSEEQTQLDITFPEEIFIDIDENKYREALTHEQMSNIIAFKQEMRDLLGPALERILKENVFRSSDSNLIRKIALDMKRSPETWKGLSYLNSDDPDRWERFLYKVVELKPGSWEVSHSKFVNFVKILPNNWKNSIPELIEELALHDIDVDKFFKLERLVSYQLSAIMADINELQKVMLKSQVDILPFVSKLSHAFLPSVVFELEEYGLPRMISKKLHNNNIFDFLDTKLTLHSAINTFHSLEGKIRNAKFWHEFDKYIINYFYDGITLTKINTSSRQ
jgi:hypothetical protein